MIAWFLNAREYGNKENAWIWFFLLSSNYIFNILKIGEVSIENGYLSVFLLTFMSYLIFSVAGVFVSKKNIKLKLSFIFFLAS